MKTKNIFKPLVLAAVLVSACGKNEIADDFKGYTLPVTINVTRQGDEPATRASYNESTRKLEFSAGDKLFVEGRDNNTAGSFKGVLTWVSGGTFSGSINTEKEYTGTADALLTDAAYVTATLLPAGYESYAFLSIEDETDCSGWVGRDLSKAFAPTKKAAVEQFSYEYTYTSSYSSGFALAPQTAILSFTISGLAANTEVAVLFKDAYDTGATPVNVTTDASGVATFAVAVNDYDYIDYYTLTVDGIDITLPDKEAEAGHIYIISRSVAPAYTLLSAATTSDYGKVVCAAGHLHDAKTAVPDGCTAVGILGKVTETGHGLILALEDVMNQTWNTINGWTSASYASTTLKVLPDDDARGYLTSYTALGATAVSNWAVAQKSDYEAIFINLGSTTGDSDGITYDDNVNAYITTGVGGTALDGAYWSPTELYR